MKNIIPPNQGKILIHGEGSGEITRDEIDTRAEEIATAEGRHRVSDDDRSRAERELLGETLPTSRDEEDSSMNSLSRDPSDPPAVRGSQTPNYEDSDEQKNVESLVVDGVEEADHEQRLEGQRKRDV